MRTLIMRAWLAARQYNSQSIPRPLDAPRVRVPGVNGTRVLIFGSGIAVGWGVASHEIALPGALARALASRSGRGADVEVHASTKITVRTALDSLRGLDVAAYDIVVVVLGANDAVAQTSLAAWRNGFSDVLAHLDTRVAARAQLLILGIPPIASVPGFASRFGAIATEHALKINQETRQLCERLERATFVPLPGFEARPDARIGDGRTYGTWATAIAEVVAPAVPSARWGFGDRGPDGTPIATPEADLDR